MLRSDGGCAEKVKKLTGDSGRSFNALACATIRLDHYPRDVRVPSFQPSPMTSTTSAQPPCAQPAQQVPLVATPQKTQETTFTSSVLSPQVSTYFIAGGVAGATSRTVVSPLERIKIIQSVGTRGSTVTRITYLSSQQTGAALCRRRETVPRSLEQSDEDMARGRVRWIHERKRDQLPANRAV